MKTTKSPLQRQLAALPARQLNLLAIGVVAIAAALVLSAVRAPLAALRVQKARLAAAAAIPVLPALSVTPGSPSPAAQPAEPARAAPAPTPLALIAAVSAGARAAGVTVASAAPGPERSVAGLNQQTLDIDASGGYAALMGWIAAIEATQPAVGVERLDLGAAQAAVKNDAQDDAGRTAGDTARRVAKLRLAIYANGSPP